MGSPLLQVAQKPAVNLVVLGEAPPGFLQALENGLEEEGIPFEMWDSQENDAVLAASQAAKASRINVGLCIKAASGSAITGVVLHHRDLPEKRPLFHLTWEEVSTESLNRLGRNAARLVKGNPFIMSPAENAGSCGDSGTKDKLF